MTNDVPNRTLPYPPNDGSTHWAGCWRAPLHHNCAVLEADALLDALDREREANRELREAAEFFMECGMERHSESHWMNEWPECAPEKCEWCRFSALLYPENAGKGKETV